MNVPLRTSVALLAFLAGAFPLTARAAGCPDSPPESASERRGLAKEFFSRAEQAENAGNDLEAVRAYQCSLKMVPHAFTAYNLGRVSERFGDLDLALRSFRAYLTLKPDASDLKDIEARIVKLEERVAAVRATATSEEPRPAQPLPTPAEAAAPVLEPPGAAEPTEPSGARDAIETSASDEPRPVMGTREWAIAGVGIAALASGLGLNVMARAKMKDCRRLHDENKPYESACDAAKPLAYSSYGVLGIAAAALIVDVALIWKNSTRVETVALAPLQGGLALSTSLRF